MGRAGAGGLGSGGEMIEQQALLEQANPRRPRFHPIVWPALSLSFTQLGQRGEKRGWGGAMNKRLSDIQTSIKVITQSGDFQTTHSDEWKL